MARVRSAILIALFLGFFFCTAQIISATKADDADVELDDHEKSLLEDPEIETSSEDDHGDLSSASSFDEGNEDLENLEDEEEPGMPAIDDKDVAVLTSANLSDFVKTNQFAVVEFYAPWCGHCQQFAPEYAAAATELKGEVPVAKIDVSEEYELAQQYQVQGFPTVYLFVNGSYKTFSGDRTKDGLVSWVKKKLGPSVANLTTTQDAETLLLSGSTAVVGLFDSLEGPENDEFEAVSKFEDEVLFYQTTSERVAAALGIDIKSKRPALVLLKKEAEKVSYYDGDFNKDAISEFVLANKLPLITPFTRESANKIFDSIIKKHILCFFSPEDYEKYKDNIQEAAKSLKGKLIFVHVDTEDADAGKQVMEYFGISEAPKIMAFLALEESKKFILEGEMTADNIKTFGEEFVGDKLKPFYKSEPIPEKNDGDVKVVVGKNFDEIVLDESKDVLLEIYAPWCGHCQALEPIYNKLGKHLREVESLVIAKMDGTLNEHPRAKSDGYPTILFFPAGNKSFDPMTVESERTVKALYKFLKKNAAVPFTLPKKAKAESPAPTTTTTEKEEAPVEKPKDAEQAKDEL